MNPRQIAQQIKPELEQVTWVGASDAVVFGTMNRVVVFAGTPNEEQIPHAFPWALIGIEGGDVDPDDPGLITQQFSITCGAEVAGDPMGEQAIIGGPITDIGTSAGRGVGDILERVRSAVQDINGTDGVKVAMLSSSFAPLSVLGQGRHLAMGDIVLSAVCTSAEYYASPQRPRYETTEWVWTGSHCASRFDFLQYRIVKKHGTTPSVSPSDGTVIYTGATASYTTTDHNSGWIYTIFADYNSRGGSTVEGSSSPELGSYKLV